MSTLPTMEERLREYATVQRGLVESTQKVLHIIENKPGTPAELQQRTELAACMGLLSVVCDDLDKILRGEELQIIMAEVIV